MKKPARIPCIFGADICADCPIRKKVETGSELDLGKYLKSKTEVLDEAYGLMNKFVDSLNSKMDILAKFCNVCPYLFKVKTE